MSSDGLLIDAARAQDVFDELPEELRLASLSPDYVIADAARDAALRPRFLLWQHGSARMLHGVHEAQIPGLDEFDWQSPYNYGGPLATGLDAAQLSAAWAAFADLACTRRVIAEFVRFHPVLDNQRQYAGTVRVQRPAVLVDVAVDDLQGSYTGRARTAIRKALNNGLQLRWLSPTEARSVFPCFYREAMRRIGAPSFYLFSDTYFARLLELPCARVLAVERGPEPLSMAVFLFGPRIVEYHLSATTLTGRSLGATNLLVHGAAQEARVRGLAGLYLGGGTDGRPNNPLLQFKSAFAAARLRFHIGSTVYDQRTYTALQSRCPEQARNGRVLFYRGERA